jgi:uncharacterized protein involved in outer membrane biogenesis
LSAKPPEQQSPRRRIALKVCGAILVGAVVLAIFFQWNWLRGPLAWVLAQKLHRPVAIAGDLEVHPWSGSPWLRLNGLTVGDRRRQPDQMSATLPRLTVGWRWFSVLSPRLDFPLVWAERPTVDLAEVTAAGGRPGFSMAGLPNIGHLVITGGAISFVDGQYRLRFAGAVSTNEKRLSARGPNDTAINGALVIASPAWAGARPLVDAPHVLLRVKLLALMQGRPGILLLKFDQPAIDGVRDGSGRGNWQFSKIAARAAPHVPPIGRLIISNGAATYRDARLKVSFVGTFSTDETVAEVGRGTFQLRGRGILGDTPFTTSVSAGPLVNIDLHHPYPFNAWVETQGTKVSAVGTMARAFDVQNVSGRLRASGPDLADLYHLTGVALPNTPPYDLSTAFAREGSHYALRRMVGRVGQSDLEGDISVDDTNGRPFLTAHLLSRRMFLTDLSAVAGGVPKHTQGRALSPIQRETAIRLTAEHRIFPDTHLDVSRIRSTDADVTYRAASVAAGRFPIRGLSLKVSLHGGQLSIDPLTMTLPQGDLAASVRLDARRAVPTEKIDVRLTNARLENLIGQGGPNPPLEGGLYARARLSGRGDSVKALAASADGDIRAVIPRGEMRQTFAELMGIDATKSLLMLITKDQGQTPVRCAVADFQAQAGVLTARRFILDTGVVLVIGKGDIDLRDEALNLQLNGRPKKFRLVRIGAPILVKGSLASPKFGVDVGKAAGQLAISGLLGAVVAPLSALLPFVSPGLAKNADCAALEREVSLADSATPPAR